MFSYIFIHTIFSFQDDTDIIDDTEEHPPSDDDKNEADANGDMQDGMKNDDASPMESDLRKRIVPTKET